MQSCVSQLSPWDNVIFFLRLFWKKTFKDTQHQFFYRSDGLRITRPSVSMHWRQLKALTTTPPPQPFYGPFLGDHPGQMVPEENFWTLWCKGRLTEVDTLTIWPGAIPSGLTSAHLHHLPIFLRAGCPSCRPTNSVKALKATSTFGLGRRHQSFPQRCYLHRLRTLLKAKHRQQPSKITHRLHPFWSTNWVRQRQERRTTPITPAVQCHYHNNHSITVIHGHY